MATSTTFAQIRSGIQFECDDTKPIASTRTAVHHHPQQAPQPAKKQRYRWQIVWRNVIAFAILHPIALYGLYLSLSGYMYLKTFMFMILMALFSGLGITAGAHRLWTHRCYNARLPMRILLALFQTLAFQNHIYEWVRDHRVHHKFTDTDADPHNSLRGFFFSHMGWLMIRKHPDVPRKGKEVDMRDLEADPVVMWQKKNYVWLILFVPFLIPSLIPYWLWGERFWYSFLLVGIARYMISLHCTWLVNSAAHLWGTKPYDNTITSTENPTVSFLVFGEGFHNYHHTFPWDYKAAELGNYWLNVSTAFIDVCARLGLAYNLKTANASLVLKRSQRTGDDTNKRVEVWGWGDTDMAEDDRLIAEISQKNDD
ncbi:acyl-CoA Delta-9 desaturase-like [Adelges cooleyi]|uniref:acyl-CoA Delta-9 desaturase-like n=1 Tax=Adelges cooleyi TaxID=133065 RepID=UPI00217FCBE4|nr:acyl-CoA Delta-9 desaturase-like [Adelges cooleyi]